MTKPKPRSGRRWLLLALLMQAFYAASYFTVSVTQKLDELAATREPSAPKPSLRGACREVLEDTWARAKKLMPTSDRR